MNFVPDVVKTSGFFVIKNRQQHLFYKMEEKNENKIRPD